MTIKAGELKTPLIMLAIAAAYIATSKLGFVMASAANDLTIVWPPAGIALAALLLFGYRVLPAIMVGAFLAEAIAYNNLQVAFGMAVGNTLAALTGAWLLRRFASFDNNISHMKDVFSLMFFAAFLSTTIAATAGVTSLCLGELLPWDSFGKLWKAWWIGDAGGVFIVAPALLLWGQSPYPRPTIRNMLEILLLTAGLFITAANLYLELPIFGFTAHPTLYPTFPFIIWAALRFGQRGTTLAVLMAATITIWSVIHGAGSFIGTTLSNRLIILQVFMIILSATGLLLGAAIAERRTAEQKLSSSRNYLRLILDSALDAIISVDRNGVITEWNKQAEAIFGWLAEEALGKSMPDMIIPPASREQCLQGIKRFQETGKAKILNKHIEQEALTRSGKIIPIELTVTVKQNGDYFFTSFIRDISDEKQAESVKGLLSSIVESSTDAIISKTLDGNITSWNAGAQRLFGYSAVEAIGRHINFIIPLDRQEEEQQCIMTQIRAGKRIEPFQTVHITKNGRPIPVSVTLSPIRNSSGKIIGASKIMHDISHLKKAEEQIMQYSKELEQSNRELDDFAYIVSHDLKEPLRGLQNFSQFLLEDYEGRLGEEGKKMLRTISDLTIRLTDNLDKLLHYSRLGRTEMAITETDLNNVVQNVIDLLDIQIKEAGANVRICKKLPTVVCDHVRITEAFQNLISNALKYSDKKGNEIEIGTLAGHPRAPEETVFYVRDHGIGIRPEHLDVIFKIFKRLHPRSAYGGGTGSGLTIAKKIISQHHGQIWAESKGEGYGTTFFFTLPQQKSLRSERDQPSEGIIPSPAA